MKKIFALMMVVCLASIGCDDKSKPTTKSSGSGSGAKTDVKKPEEKKPEEKKPEEKKPEEKKPEEKKADEKKDAPKDGPKVK